ncbi:MAG: stage II sporulation protein M [Methanoregula sp.]|jgi:stage II sporulation protein M|uniref:stage II sporulation protein M n=1 Tax=Methanoregula sp. TaxID=2052170 RepID=UPI003C1BD7BA
MSDSPLTNALVITFLLFMTTMCVGWIGSAQNPAVGQDLMKLFEKEVAGQMSGENPADMCVKLFANNFEACIFLFLGGASFGILTIFIMSLNGIVIGAIMELVSKDHSALFVAAAILPHGVFEIPAFIISGALGIMLAQSLIAEWYGAGDTAPEAKHYARLFILYVIPLVAIAASVEAFITPVVIHLVA